MRTASTKSLGETVRALRTDAGMTQWALAAASGLALSTIQNIEGGRAPHARKTTLRLIADALGADVATLQAVA